MENKKVHIQSLPEAIGFPTYTKTKPGVFYLKVSSFKRVFKGKEEIDLANKLQYSIQKDGKIYLRPFERVLVGTGLIFILPEGLKLNIVSKDTVTLTRGLTVLSSYMPYGEELCILLYNGSQFLTEVSIGNVIAEGSFVSIEAPEFISNVSIEK